MTSMRKTIVVITAARSVAARVRPVPRCGRVMREGRWQKEKSDNANARKVSPHAGYTCEPHGAIHENFFPLHTDGVEHESSRNTLGESAGRNAICLTRSTNYLVNEQPQRVKIDYAQRVCDNTIERVAEMRLRALACSLYALAGNSVKRENTQHAVQKIVCKTYSASIDEMQYPQTPNLTRPVTVALTMLTPSLTLAES